MSTDLFPLLSYVFISTFTPGPSNISSASIAVLHGYKNTLNYQGGLAAGVFLAMLLSGWISTTLLGIFPALEPVLRYAGAGYILHLAVGILKASYAFTDQNVEPLGFGHGLMLQALNPKLIVYAFTLFSAFLKPNYRQCSSAGAGSSNSGRSFVWRHLHVGDIWNRYQDLPSQPPSEGCCEYHPFTFPGLYSNRTNRSHIVGAIILSAVAGTEMLRHV